MKIFSYLLLAAFALSISTIACKDEDEPKTEYQFILENNQTFGVDIWIRQDDVFMDFVYQATVGVDQVIYT